MISPRWERIMRFLRNLARRTDGATAIEYGLIVALVSLASIMAFLTLGLSLNDVFGTLSNAMRGA